VGADLKRTRLSVCRRKVRFASASLALAAAVNGGWILRPYRCDRCGAHHLTSRRKGHHTPAKVRAQIAAQIVVGVPVEGLQSGGTSGSEEETL